MWQINSNHFGNSFKALKTMYLQMHVFWSLKNLKVQKTIQIPTYLSQSCPECLAGFSEKKSPIIKPTTVPLQIQLSYLAQ
jgi:hypothetical protein